MRLTSWIVCAALLGGCATHPQIVNDGASRAGQVGMTEISGMMPHAAHMELADNESFLMPLEDDANPLPVYPAALLLQGLAPQAVCVRVGVSGEGSVLSFAPAVVPPSCPEPADAAFLDAVRSAVAGWRYEPALRCVFPDAETKDDTVGSCGGYTEIPEAVTLTYRFVFEQKDGRGSVQLAR